MHIVRHEEMAGRKERGRNRRRKVDGKTLSILLNFIVRIQSPEKLNHMLKITLQMSSRNWSRSQLPDRCLYICHLQLNYICLESRDYSSLQTYNT